MDSDSSFQNGQMSEPFPEIIPIVPVVDVALFPKMQLPLMVGQPQLMPWEKTGS